MAKQKYYVVWSGHSPGIYRDWPTAQKQIKGYPNAKFKSYKSRTEADKAFRQGPSALTSPSPSHPRPRKKNIYPTTSRILSDSISVDAACSGNPGRMEYQGVTTSGRHQIFHRAFALGTNNIGEFLAIVHALALLKKQDRPDLPIYTDSRTAMGWIKKKKCKTTLVRNTRTAELHEYIERAEAWLNANEVTNPIYKWQTEIWGEIPADFGRK